MVDRSTTYATQNQPVAGREGLRDLLRSRTVTVVLTLAAVGQFAAVQAKEPASAGPNVVAELSPLVVLGAERAESPRPAATEDLAMELAASYRARGFQVTDKLAREIHDAARANDIDPDIAFGLVHAESGFKNVATSRVGAIGLTQLMPNTARWLEPGVTRSELRNPETNLRIGFRYLNDLIEKYDGNVNLALTAYNRGPGTVDRALKRGRNPDNGYADFVRTGRRGRHRG